ncbi:uncharacterized protein PAC_17785 [Phialocephala subalpina]|uniref:Uncharacterized protein n=1 Tax=Phialocephala subalpina TaxID=576137 RepID=A0A1L7XS55_9HELO|nr:uncharacterized protein PAC_17785 [Phialocephala subalpina]
MGSCFSSSRREQTQTPSADLAPKSDAHELAKKDLPQQGTSQQVDGATPAATSEEPAFDPFSSEHDTTGPRKPSAFELASASYAPATTFTGPEGKKDELPAITDEAEEEESAAGKH